MSCGKSKIGHDSKSTLIMRDQLKRGIFQFALMLTPNRPKLFHWRVERCERPSMSCQKCLSDMATRNSWSASMLLSSNHQSLPPSWKPSVLCTTPLFLSIQQQIDKPDLSRPCRMAWRHSTHNVTLCRTRCRNCLGSITRFLTRPKASLLQLYSTAVKYR